MTANIKITAMLISLEAAVNQRIVIIILIIPHAIDMTVMMPDRI